MNKVCSKCKEEKLIEEFNKNKNRKDGYTASCKQCIKNYKHNYYLVNKPEILAKCEEYKTKTGYQKKYYHTRKQKFSEYKKKHYKKHKESIKKYHQLYVTRERDHINAYNREYRKLNDMKTTDAVIARNIIGRNSILNVDDIPKGMIEIAKLNLQLKRELKKCKQNHLMI